MKKVIFLISILISFISCSNNKPAEFKHGNLWKITSKNGSESYLFSTLHLYPKEELEISPKAISILKKCNTLALEFNMLDSLERQKFNDFDMPKSLSNGYDALITEYNPEELSSMEIQIIEIARENELKIIGLEPADEMLAILEKFKKTKESKKKIDNQDLIKIFKNGFKLYKEENIKAVKEEMLEDQPKTTALIVDQRNENWIGDIVNFPKENKTFIAVGMAHLGGENGILNLLQKQGFKIERIES